TWSARARLAPSRRATLSSTVHAYVPLLAAVPDDRGARALPCLVSLQQFGRAPHAAEVLGGGHGAPPARAQRELPL
ncbi:hypothetical protein, partial [Streptomyces sp. HYC2]|uniref:hypothetical protein n=1 Tax=Streptomyces sp. HYC2 TaxID=2955207 RepID=UPI0024802A5D